MKRLAVLFISLFLTPIGVGDNNREASPSEPKTWEKILRVCVQEYEFPHREIIEPIFYKPLDAHIGRV